MNNDGVLGVVTDETWRVSSSPILFNSVVGGEVYDARLEQPGWNSPEDQSPIGQVLVTILPMFRS